MRFFPNFFKSIVRISLYALKCFFLGVFKVIKVLSEVIYKTIKYILNGVLFSSYYIYKLFSSFFKYLIYGILYFSILMYKSSGKLIIYFTYASLSICFGVYKIFKYLTYGFYFPFVLVFDKIRITREKNAAKNEEIRLKKLKKQVERKLKKQQIQEAKVLKKAAIAEKKRQLKEAKKKKNEFVSENVVIEKQSFGKKITAFFKSFTKFPLKTKQLFKKWYSNLLFVKNKKNRYEMEHQELLINFEGEDGVKSAEKIPYEYVAKSQDGKIVKGHYEAFSKAEVHSFLLSENYEVYSIKTSSWIKLKYGRNRQSRTKFKTKDLIFLLTQLSTYIKSGITLIEALRILARQYKKAKYKQIIRNVIYELTMGESFSEAMLKQGKAFPKLLINMVKTAEMTGELPETLDDMAEYYTESDATRKQMITAMTYPTIIFVLATAVIIFVLMFVVPQFTDMYSTMENSKIPGFTLFVIGVSDFLKHNVFKIFIAMFVVVIIFVSLYKNIKSFKTIIQWLLMHMPVVANVIIYNEVTMFTKTFASLLKHNVFITDSMEILTKVTNNEIYKMIILDTISNLAHGDKLSMSFKGHWAFPLPAYEMLVTGEKTGQLPEMMGKVSSYYQELHKNSVTRIKTFVEPILIIFLTVIVGGIVLAIIIPMFNLYQTVQG